MTRLHIHLAPFNSRSECIQLRWIDKLDKMICLSVDTLQRGPEWVNAPASRDNRCNNPMNNKPSTNHRPTI